MYVFDLGTVFFFLILALSVFFLILELLGSYVPETTTEKIVLSLKERESETLVD